MPELDFPVDPEPSTMIVASGLQAATFTWVVLVAGPGDGADRPEDRTPRNGKRSRRVRDELLESHGDEPWFDKVGRAVVDGGS